MQGKSNPASLHLMSAEACTLPSPRPLPQPEGEGKGEGATCCGRMTGFVLSLFHSLYARRLRDQSPGLVLGSWERPVQGSGKGQVPSTGTRGRITYREDFEDRPVRGLCPLPSGRARPPRHRCGAPICDSFRSSGMIRILLCDFSAPCAEVLDGALVSFM